MGHLAAKKLLEWITTRKVPNSAELPVELVVRATTGVAPR